MPVSTEGREVQESKVYILELEKRPGQLLKLGIVEVETASETPRVDESNLEKACRDRGEDTRWTPRELQHPPMVNQRRDTGRGCGHRAREVGRNWENMESRSKGERAPGKGGSQCAESCQEVKGDED